MKVGNIEVTLTEQELKDGYDLAQNAGVGTIAVGRLLVALANRIERLEKIVGLGQPTSYLDTMAKQHVEQARVCRTQVETRS